LFQKSIFTAPGPVPLIKGSAGVSFSKSTITVQPGKTAKVTVTFTQPKGLDASRYPVYSGFLKITSKSETLKVTYMGLAASLKKKTVIDNTDIYFGNQIPVLLNSGGAPQNGLTNYTMKGACIVFPPLPLALTFTRQATIPLLLCTG
jgi:hypothetical protein